MNYELRSKNVLYIDTSSNLEAVVTLVVGGKESRLTKKYDKSRSQVVLPLIKQLLSDQNLVVRDITEIQVNPGPGSFTGLRVGVAIANALGIFLNVSINNKEIGQVVEPIYT